VGERASSKAARPQSLLPGASPLFMAPGRQTYAPHLRRFIAELSPWLECYMGGASPCCTCIPLVGSRVFPSTFAPCLPRLPKFGCLRVLNNPYYRTKRGEAGWLAVGREVEKAHAGGLKAEGGGHLPLLLRGASRAPRSGKSSSSRSGAAVPRRSPFTRNFMRSGDDANR
jgi:hypothetical protein